MTPKILTCVIIDSQQLSIDMLTSYIQHTPSLVLNAAFSHVSDALIYLLKTPIDLLIIDINMSPISGIYLYNNLHTLFHTKVIFMSSYPEKIMEAIQYTDKVVDYLPKPVSLKRFEESILKAKISDRISIEDLPRILERTKQLSVTQLKVLQLLAQQLTTRINVTEPEISLILNSDGIVKIGKSLYQYNEKDIKIIANGDYSKVPELVGKTQKNARTIKQAEIFVYPVNSTPMVINNEKNAQTRDSEMDGKYAYTFENSGDITMYLQKAITYTANIYKPNIQHFSYNQSRGT